MLFQIPLAWDITAAIIVAVFLLKLAFSRQFGEVSPFAFFCLAIASGVALVVLGLRLTAAVPVMVLAFLFTNLSGQFGRYCDACGAKRKPFCREFTCRQCGNWFHDESYPEGPTTDSY